MINEKYAKGGEKPKTALPGGGQETGVGGYARARQAEVLVNRKSAGRHPV